MRLRKHAGKIEINQSLFKRGERVLVGVSGGVDSMVLLHLLHGLAEESGWKLFVAHFNHQLRGRSSDADERLVLKTARVLGLRCVCAGAAVRQIAKMSGQSLEMAARELRHAFLARAARRLRCRKIALAHHADDQVELFFLRLLRGAGGEGLAGMKCQSRSPANPAITLVRPLLDFDRSAIESFAREQRIPFRNDASNARLDARRNRIRHELLPLLKSRYQPALSRTVLRLMQITGDESSAITGFAERWLAAKDIAFDKLPVAVQRRCLQLQLHRLKLATDFDLIEFLRQSENCSVSVGAKVCAVRDIEGIVHLSGKRSEAFNLSETKISLDGSAGHHIFDGVKFFWQISRRKKSSTARKPGHEFFDADAVGTVIVLRHWRPGDRYVPIGMAGSAKLQDCFTNRGIAASTRRRLVVATTEAGEIFWVEGLRIAEDFKLRPGTRRCLTWRWLRP